jgi:hypothetical protein
METLNKLHFDWKASWQSRGLAAAEKWFLGFVQV